MSARIWSCLFFGVFLFNLIYVAFVLTDESARILVLAFSGLMLTDAMFWYRRHRKAYFLRDYTPVEPHAPFGKYEPFGWMKAGIVDYGFVVETGRTLSLMTEFGRVDVAATDAPVMVQTRIAPKESKIRLIPENPKTKLPITESDASADIYLIEHLSESRRRIEGLNTELNKQRM